MDFGYTDEHQMLKETLEKFFLERYSDSLREENFESEQGYSNAIWNELCELGVLAALITEEQGGFGGKGDDITIIFQSLGYALATEPFLSAGVLGLRLAAELGLSEIVEQCSNGEKQITLAHFEPESRYDPSFINMIAIKSKIGYSLSGRKSMVYGAQHCDQLLVSARLDSSTDKIALFLIDRNQNGMRCFDQKLIDGSQSSEIIIEDLQVSEESLVNTDANAVINKIIAFANLALSAEALGAMKKVQEMTVEYMKDREQFGRSISSFQALQHRCVDMLIEIEQFDAAIINAASMMDQSTTQNDKDKAISSAKYLAGKTGKLVAEESIQLHGGIGMTWEYPLGHYAKRITMIDHQFGDSDYHLERFMKLSA